MSNLTKDLHNYFSKAAESRENHSDEAMSALCKYVQYVDRSIDEMIKAEMDKVRARF